MFVLGITGPSGSGKSYASKLLAGFGFAVINADETARSVVAPGSPCLIELSEAFGNDIIKPDGTLDRKLLAKKAFSDKTLLDKLNSTTHPFIMEAIKGEIKELEQKGANAAVLDAPTLFESDADKLCDAVLAVIADKELCKKRIIERDKLTEEQAEQRLAAQKPDSYYAERTRYVIKNKDDPELFAGQISDIVKMLKI